MDLGLEGRTVIVTGGSSGVGLATVGVLVAEGANVATCARDGDRLRAAVAALPGPGAVLAVPADVTDAGAVERLVEATVERFGRIDGLVNNAGRSRTATFADTSDADWCDELTLKIGSVVNTVRACRPHLAATRGAIVNVNAVLARQPEPHLVATAAARAAVLNLSRSLATELAPDGIRVNSVLLGLIHSGQWRRRWEASGTSEPYERWTDRIAADRGVPLGRFGHPGEVADVICFLLSPRAGYLTGASVDVAGGVGRYV